MDIAFLALIAALAAGTFALVVVCERLHPGGGKQ
jgi:hypothetical protein